MSEGMSVSVGNVGAVASAGPSVAVGASMSGEFTASGVGFDGGSPSFSGLGRSDSGLGALSVNEGPIGPVSFSNATNLFSETRAFSASLGSIGERPVSGGVFGGDMVTIAKASSETTEAKTSGISVFDNLAPVSIIMPTNEGPAPMPSLGEFSTVSFAPDTSFGFESKSDQEPEVSVEAVIEAETAEMGFVDTDIKDVVEDLKTNDPLTYMQLKSDLESVRTILDIVDEVTDSQTATSISNIAISTAVDRSGLVQALEVASEEPEPETKTEPSTDPIDANVQAIMDSINPPAEEIVEQRQVQPRSEYFVDEKANAARQSETAQAIKTAFEKDRDPETGIVAGKAVVDILPAEPPTEEISEIVLKEGGRNDGSEAQRRNDLALLKFETQEEALAANDRLIEENRAVTDEEAVKRATIAEAAKVKSGIKSSITEIEVYPLAA